MPRLFDEIDKYDGPDIWFRTMPGTGTHRLPCVACGGWLERPWDHVDPTTGDYACEARAA
jgi:hypothetical protein